MNELKFIKYITKRFSAKKPVIKGIGDDCAVLEYTKTKYMLFTTDMIIEGTHFSKNAPPYKIGWKSMAVNISDVAAMGGLPKYALVSCGIPKNKSVRFLRDMIKGIAKICKKFNIQVIGGDTNASGKVTVNVTLAGEVEKKCLITRSGARTGDLAFVTGALGEGRRKHMHFLPRLREARILAKNFKINSMIDLSDGLAMDLARLTEASKKGARIYKSLIPLSEKSEPIDRSIYSGEDFELLFTASKPESKKIIKRMGKKEDLPVTLIGEILDKRFGVKLVEDDGKARQLKPKGFAHL